MREHEPLVEAVTPLAELAEKVPTLEGVPTGVPGLDELFFVTEWRDGKPMRRTLGGIPRYAVLQVTGVSDTGKSLLVEQFAVERARHGETCVFVTTEAPGPFAALSLQLRARAMGVPVETIDRSIVLIDAATHTSLAHDLGTLLSTLTYAIRTYRAKAVVIDSLTGFYEAREMQAREIVRPLYLFLKRWHQTALAVSQKRSGHELLTAEAAGGFAVGHILDGSLVLAKQTILSPQQARLYRTPIGETVRLFRIDGCRLSGHDTTTHLLEITPEGLVRIGPQLTELVRSAHAREEEGEE